MFNLGSGEIALIAVAALLILGPKRLPELARGIGKFMREFRRQTDEVRGVVEREFYRMDAPQPPPLAVQPSHDAVAHGADAHVGAHGADGLALPVDDTTSQLLKGASAGEPVPPPPAPAAEAAEAPAPSAEPGPKP